MSVSTFIIVDVVALCACMILHGCIHGIIFALSLNFCVSLNPKCSPLLESLLIWSANTKIWARIFCLQH